MTRKEAVRIVARRLRVRAREWSGWQINNLSDAKRLAGEILSSGSTEQEIMEVADRAEDNGTYGRLLSEIARETLSVPW